MNARERKIYNLELELIEKHFKGLRPRPVKLVKELDNDNARASEPFLLVKNRKWSSKDVEKLIKHELIHYELKDKGKDYHGHGQAFLRRAKQLGIVGLSELILCFSAEEEKYTASVRELRKILLPQLKLDIDRQFIELIEKIAELPENYKLEIYPYVQNVCVGWSALTNALENGNDYVVQEIWRKRRGPRRNSLETSNQKSKKGGNHGPKVCTSGKAQASLP